MIKTVLTTAKAKLRSAALDVMCKQLMAVPASGGRKPFNFEELKMLRAALLSQNLCCIDGQMVSEFERKFSFDYGVPYGVASTSGTAAIHVALGALDLEPGDEVITAPITDLGTIIPILSQGAIPVFADVDRTLNMDPASVEKCITSRTKAIIVVHLFGNPVRHGRDVGDRQTPQHAAHRGLLAGALDRLQGQAGRDDRRHRVLQLSAVEAHDDRRRRHDDHVEPGVLRADETVCRQGVRAERAGAPGPTCSTRPTTA